MTSRATLLAARRWVQHYQSCVVRACPFCKPPRCATCDHLAARLRHEADQELSAEERETLEVAR